MAAVPLDAAQIQAIVQAAVAAAIAGLPPQQPPVAAANPVDVPFAISPAGAGNAPWDFSSSTGLKLYLAVVAPFSTPFDGNEETLNDFLRRIWNRAKSFGLVEILRVADKDGIARDLT